MYGTMKTARDFIASILWFIISRVLKILKIFWYILIGTAVFFKWCTNDDKYMKTYKTFRKQDLGLQIAETILFGMFICFGFILMIIIFSSWWF